MNLEIPTAQTLNLLKPFLLSQKQGRDIITRSLLLVPQGDRVWLYSTDGISHIRARLPAQIDGFEDPVVFDLDTFHSVLKAGNEKTRLEKRGDLLWGDFYGGKIHLQTYTFDPDLFRGRLPKRGGTSCEADKGLYLRALKSLQKVTETADVSDLCYVFLTSQGAFASNGSLVAKVNGTFQDIALRKRDCKLVETLLELEEGTIFKITVYKDRIMVRTTFLDYVFPMVDQRLSEQYRARPGASGDFFRVENQFLRHVLRLVTNLPNSTGVLTLDFEEKLDAQIRGRKGQISNFRMADDREGEPVRMKVQTLAKTMLLATSVFDRDEALSLGVRTDGSLLMWNDDKALNFVTKPALG